MATEANELVLQSDAETSKPQTDSVVSDKSGAKPTPKKSHPVSSSGLSSATPSVVSSSSSSSKPDASGTPDAKTRKEGHSSRAEDKSATSSAATTNSPKPKSKSDTSKTPTAVEGRKPVSPNREDDTASMSAQGGDLSKSEPESNLASDKHADDSPTLGASAPLHHGLCDVCSTRSDSQQPGTHFCLQCQQIYCCPCRQGHDVYTFGRAHAVVSYRPAGAEQTSPSSERDVPNTQTCSDDTCRQCESTLHEDSPADVLTGAKEMARDNLKEKRRILEKERQRLDGLLSAITNSCNGLRSLEEATIQHTQARVQLLQAWLNQSFNQAVLDIETLSANSIASLQIHIEDLKSQQVALNTQIDELTRVLNEESGVIGIPALAAQLSVKSALQTDSIQTKLLEGLAQFNFQYDETAVNSLMIRDFIGYSEFTQTDEERPRASSAADDVASATDQASAPQAEEVSVSEKQLCCKKVIFTTSCPMAVVAAVVPTSTKSLWVVFRQDLNASVTYVSRIVNEEMTPIYELHMRIVVGTSVITVQKDTLLMLLFDAGSQQQLVQWVRPDGKSGTCDVLAGEISALLTSTATGCHYMCVSDKVYRLEISSVQPWKVTKHLVMKKRPSSGVLLDISAGETHFAFVDDDKVEVFTCESPKKCTLRCRYKAADHVCDVRFCKIDGKERLLALSLGDNQPHVIDHLDNLKFLGRVNTLPLALHKPWRMATDYESRLWIGCNNGTVFEFDLKCPFAPEGDCLA